MIFIAIYTISQAVVCNIYHNKKVAATYRFFQNAFSFAASETWAFTLQQIRICTVTLQTVSLSYIGRRFVTEGYQVVVDLICKSSASFQ